MAKHTAANRTTQRQDMRKASRLPVDWTKNARCSGSENFWWIGDVRTISRRMRHCSLDCNKKVNQEMAPERFSSSLPMRQGAHFVSAANWLRVSSEQRSS
jgi:hypothetical protein